MEPVAAIAIIETDLRRLVRVVLSSGHGPDWLDQVLDPDTLDRLRMRQVEESKRRAPGIVPTNLLAYTHLFELRKILEKCWEEFAPALGPKKDFVVLMDKVEDCRNAPAHSRELLPHERALLEGISGTVRNQVTRYLSDQDPDGEHYPVIEWVRDSFGNELDLLGSTDTGSVSLSTGLTLQVGETVQFEARGWDPQGRELTWQWAPISARNGPTVVGNDVSFAWAPTENEVGSSTFLEVQVTSSGRYHRHQSYDQRVNWWFRVAPPSIEVLEEERPKMD